MNQNSRYLLDMKIDVATLKWFKFERFFSLTDYSINFLKYEQNIRRFLVVILIKGLVLERLMELNYFNLCFGLYLYFTHEYSSVGRKKFNLQTPLKAVFCRKNLSTKSLHVLSITAQLR